jgi:anthranilate synthase/aminodeoxychorismate synthase-like glutamine amidotransferase
MTRPRVLVIDHHDSYTWNLVHLVAQVTGVLPEVVEHDEVTSEALLARRFSHLVLSPGPGHPDIADDFSVGRSLLLEADVPVLGVCLGMQGLVSAYGGRVAQISPAHGEVARVEHNGAGLFAGVPQSFDAVRYHSLAAVALPDVFEETAWCEDEGGHGRVVMAVVHREKPLYGVQFHPESILTAHGARLIANFLEVR